MRKNIKSVNHKKERVVEKLDKKVDRMPQELKRIIIDTSKSPEKRDSTELLNELRYGVR